METIQTKCCSKCKVEKSIIEFNAHKKTKDKLNCWCKKCCKEYNSSPENKQKTSIRKKIYRAKPEVKERNRERNKEYYSRPEVRKHRNSKRKQYRLTYNSKPKNKETRNKRSRERYHNDTDYRFKVSIMAHIRGVEKRNEFIEEWGEVEKVYVMYGIKYHIDHKVPKNWFKSTTPKAIVNDIRNLQVIDACYNVTKKDRWADPICDEYKKMIFPHIKKEFVNRLAESN